MNANRVYTSRVPVISKDAAERYDVVLLLTPEGKYNIAPLLENAITSTRAKLDETRAARRAQLAARRRRHGGQQPAGP